MSLQFVGQDLVAEAIDSLQSCCCDGCERPALVQLCTYHNNVLLLYARAVQSSDCVNSCGADFCFCFEMMQRCAEGLADANVRNLERQGAMKFKDTERSASLCAPEAVEEVGRTFATPAICI